MALGINPGSVPQSLHATRARLSCIARTVACNQSVQSLALDKAAILKNAAPSISWAA